MTSIVSIYINGVNVTSSLIPNGSELKDWAQAKQITFVEPSSPSISIAVLAEAKDMTWNTAEQSGIQLMCSSTRSNSQWNYVISDPSTVPWQSVPIDLSTGLPTIANWMSPDISFAAFPAISSTSKFFIRDPSCGPLNRFKKVASSISQAETARFALKATLTETQVCTPAGENASSVPTTSPTTYDPFIIEFDTTLPVDGNWLSISPLGQGGWGNSIPSVVNTQELVALQVAQQFWQTTITRSFPSSVCISAGTTLCGLKFEETRCTDNILVFVGADQSLPYVFVEQDRSVTGLSARHQKRFMIDADLHNS